MSFPLGADLQHSKLSLNRPWPLVPDGLKRWWVSNALGNTTTISNNVHLPITKNDMQRCYKKPKTLGHDVPDQLPTTATLQTIDAAIAALTQLGKQLDEDVKQQQYRRLIYLQPLSKHRYHCKMGLVKPFLNVWTSNPFLCLETLADRLVDKLGDSAVVLVSETNGKGHAIAKVSPTVLSKLTAKDLINDLTSITGGGGGGRDNMAQAGGIGADHIDAGIAHITKKYA